MRTLVIIALLLAFIIPNASAVSSDRPEISVTPFLQNVSIGTQANETFDITYANNSNKQQSLTLNVADFGSLDQSGGVAFVGSEFGKLLDKYTLTPWLNLSQNSFNLEPGQKTIITATVINNPKMGPGGHYGAVVATVVAPGGGGKSQVSLKQKISSLVFAVKTGGERYDLKLQKVENNGSLLHLPSEVYLTTRSTGNVHVVPRGVVYLKTKSGKVIAKGAINQESGYVLPDTSRIFMVKLDKVASTSFLDNSFSLQVDYRYDGLSTYASKRVGIHVISPLFFAVVVLALGFIFLWTKRHNLRSLKIFK